MEEGIPNNTSDQQREKKWEVTWDGFVEEAKKTCCIATPMVLSSMLQYLLQVVSIVFVGHLGQFELSGFAIAITITNVVGFSLLSGMAGGLETLCGQAYGAQQYQKLGTYTYSAIISLTMLCPVISVPWIFMHKLLPLIGQDPSISKEVRKFSLFLIPGLFGGAILKPMTRFLQTQSLTLLMLTCSFVVLCVHTMISWILVYKFGLGGVGSALAFSLSTWLNVVLLATYIMYSSACAKTRSPLTKQAFLGIPEFLRLGVPSAFMVCLKWWSMELLVLLSGLLPNPKLETSVLSICLTLSTLHFTIPYGFGAAASTRISNELGAGNPQSARMALLVATCLAGIDAVTACISVYFSRYVLGLLYTNDQQIVGYVSKMAPFLCLSLATDSLQAILSGVAKGCGWQHTGAYINLGAFYCIGLPVSVLLGFLAHLKAKGFWIGIVVGSIVQSILLSLIASCTDWETQVNEARQRIFKKTTSNQEN